MATTTPNITWSVDGIPVSMHDWSCNSIVNGGFDQMRGSLRGTTWTKLKATTVQGSIVRADLPNGKAMWEGRLSAPPTITEGEAAIVAQGHKLALERQTTRRFYMSRDYSLFQSVADEPINEVTVDAIEADVHNSALVFRKIGDGTTVYASGNKNGVAVWVPDCLLTRIDFTFNQHNGAAAFDIRINEFTGPSGATTLVLDTPMNTATGTYVDSGTIATPQDGIQILLRGNGASTPARPSLVRLTNVRVFGLTATATYTVEELLEGLAAHAAVNFNSDAVSSGLSFNPLPIDWEGQWSDLCDYVCMLEDATWRVLEKGSDGKPKMEAFKWSAATNWKARRSTGAQLDLTSLELFNKVTVSYPSQNGSTRQVNVLASPDPLSASGMVNTHFEELEDVQKNNTLATTVGTNMAAKLSAQRYSGTIELTSALDPAGRDAAWEIKAGDTVTVEDWAPGEDKLMRVFEVEYTPGSVTLGIEDDISADRILALSAKYTDRQRRKKGRKG